VTTYLVAEGRDGYAAIINKNLPLDATTSEKDVSLSSFATFNGRLMAKRGYINPRWTGRKWAALPAEQSVSSFVDDGYVVAVAVSNRYYVGAIAALPLAYVRAQTRSVAAILLPVGMAAGIALAMAALYLSRLQMAMPAVIKTALKRNEFMLHYQPIVNLRTQQWVGAEALIRWRRPTGEIMRPELFIPVAEDAGMIQRITQRVIELLARDIGDLFIRHPEFHIAMNLSSADLQSESTVGLLRSSIR
jgi:sensor c-di-GMP phosphodiesterase-like protein